VKYFQSDELFGGIKKSFMVLNYFSMENDRTPYSNQTISDQSLKNTKKMCKLVNRVFISEVLNIIYVDF